MKKVVSSQVRLPSVGVSDPNLVFFSVETKSGKRKGLAQKNFFN